MIEIPGLIRDRALRAAIVERLSAARWLPVALALALLAAWGIGLPVAGVAAGLFLLVLASPWLASGRTALPTEPAGRADHRGSQLESHSAADLAAAVPDAMIIFDGHGATVHANDAAVSAFGSFTAALPLQRKFRAPEMQELIGALLDGAAQSAAVEYIERVPIERVYRVTATRIRGGDGLFVMLFKDQSETRRTDRMRADFIANASHELRTPLASIAGFVETLRGPARDDAKARDRFLGIMQEQTGRMARLIDDLLSLSRLETKPFLASGTEVDIRETVESVIDSLGPAAREAGVKVVRDFPDGAVTIPGSRDELFQVFENLLENACKYGQSGGRVIVSIRRPEEDSDGDTTVSFRDFGPGIAAEHIPRITERFYRVDVDANGGRKGTGLGLAIVKHILTRHNARLAITSEVGRGSEFIVHFPPPPPVGLISRV